GGGSGFTFSQQKPNEGVSTGAFSFGAPKPSGGFPFGQGTSSAGFNFGAKPAEQSSSTLFGTSTINPSPFTPTPPATSSGPSFTFGGGSTTTAPSAFGQDTSGATPNSPFLAPQPATTSSPSFAFNVPPIQNSFGATKADGNASSSPSTTPFQFGQPNGQVSGSQPLFNLGGAAVTPPRKMKALPTRRPRRP
ncbi:MAG TPA: hypothetical protein VGO47_00365, partial [Chlamydiales bacterium]|nr:hypothetical protein [Chlamydiales bacterium]